MRDRQQSLIAAAILSALSLPACTPDARNARADSSPSPRAYVSHGGAYAGGAGANRRPGQSGDEGDADSSGSEGSHGGFGEAGAAGDAGG